MFENSYDIGEITDKLLNNLNLLLNLMFNQQFNQVFNLLRLKANIIDLILLRYDEELDYEQSLIEELNDDKLISHSLYNI